MRLPRALRMPAVVLLGALAVRVAYVLSIRHAIFFDHLQTEPERYDAWARAIVAGASAARLPFDEAPGYPYGLALLYGAFGRSVLFVCVVQALLDAASCAAIAVTARRLAGDRAGWAAGALAAIFAPMIYFTGQLEPATLAVFAVSMALVATPLGDGVEDATPRRWTIAGVLWALALLARSEIALALPLVLVHAWRVGGRRALARGATPIAAYLALSLVLNLASSGHAVVLTAGSGANLWIGNNPSADAVSPFIHGPMQAVVERLGEQTPDPVEADASLRARALAFMTERPGAEAHLACKKLLWTLTDRELPNASDIEWQTAHSAVFHPPWIPVRFGVVLALALAGAVLLGRRWRRALVLAAPLLVALGVCVVFFTNARFRLIAAPALLVLAGLGADGIVRRLPERRRNVRPLALAAVAAAVAALAAWSNPFGVWSYEIPQIVVNVGELEREAHHPARAILLFGHALRADPTDAVAWTELALTYEEAGDSLQAEAVWRAALARLPNDPMVREQAARFVRRHPR